MWRWPAAAGPARHHLAARTWMMGTPWLMTRLPKHCPTEKVGRISLIPLLNRGCYATAKLTSDPLQVCCVAISQSITAPWLPQPEERRPADVTYTLQAV